MYSNQLLKSALACAVTLGMGSVATAAMAAPPMGTAPGTVEMAEHKTDAMMAKKKYTPCYGINAAYKNDCVSPGHSCAGQDAKARDPGAFVAIPAGLCTKIAGGSLKAG